MITQSESVSQSQVEVSSHLTCARALREVCKDLRNAFNKIEIEGQFCNIRHDLKRILEADVVTREVLRRVEALLDHDAARKRARCVSELDGHLSELVHFDFTYSDLQLILQYSRILLEDTAQVDLVISYFEGRFKGFNYDPSKENRAKDTVDRLLGRFKELTADDHYVLETVGPLPAGFRNQ